MEPGRVSLRIRLRTTAGPGRFQSSGSTSQRMMSYPNSSWIHRFSRSVIDPYGGRSKVGRLPVALLIASSVRCTWLRTFSCDILREVRMRPTVVANFVAFLGSPGDDFRMFRDVFANHEERRLDVVRGKQIEQFRRKDCAGSIIKGHGDIRSIHVHGTERDRRFFRRGWTFLSRLAPRAEPQARLPAQMWK